ncbi:MAG: inorganic pyrophosphatase [Chloroflexi bacterium]|nr:MAG: inorganic pyrophosphatase [Chloroflexota bacterium]
MPERFNAEFWHYLDKLVNSSTVVIDRPRGSTHPDYDDEVYPLDYGYLAGTTSSDGGGIDVWIGAAGSTRKGDHRVEGVLCTVDLVKRDTELKILLGCSEEEMRIITGFVSSHHMGCYLLRRETE